MCCIIEIHGYGCALLLCPGDLKAQGFMMQCSVHISELRLRSVIYPSFFVTSFGSTLCSALLACFILNYLVSPAQELRILGLNLGCWSWGSERDPWLCFTFEVGVDRFNLYKFRGQGETSVCLFQRWQFGNLCWFLSHPLLRATVYLSLLKARWNKALLMLLCQAKPVQFCFQVLL